jgi:hypothetical protein
MLILTVSHDACHGLAQSPWLLSCQPGEPPWPLADHVVGEGLDPRVGVEGVAQSLTTRPSLAHSSGTSSTWASISRLMWVRITRVAPSSARWAAMAA